MIDRDKVLRAMRHVGWTCCGGSMVDDLAKIIEHYNTPREIRVGGGNVGGSGGGVYSEIERVAAMADPEAWRDEYRKKQAAGVKYEYLVHTNMWEDGIQTFCLDKGRYREVIEPIPHLAHRKLRSKLETIEQKTYRLGKLTIPAWDRDAFPTFEESLEDDYFISACKMIEMAIAEEREACVQRASLWTVQGRYMSTRLHAEMLSAIRARGGE